MSSRPLVLCIPTLSSPLPKAGVSNVWNADWNCQDMWHQVDLYILTRLPIICPCPVLWWRRIRPNKSSVDELDQVCKSMKNDFTRCQLVNKETFSPKKMSWKCWTLWQSLSRPQPRKDGRQADCKDVFLTTSGYSGVRESGVGMNKLGSGEFVNRPKWFRVVSNSGILWHACYSWDHRVGRVQSFSPVVGIGTPPTPHPQVCVPPPPGSGGEGAHSLAREGGRESQFRRGDIHCGTVYIYVLCGWNRQTKGSHQLIR